MQKLKPETDYTLSDDDLKFALELAKVGSVHLLTSQVSLTPHKSEKSFIFISYAGDKKCDGLSIPENWVIECVGCDDGKLSITFGVKK